MKFALFVSVLLFLAVVTNVSGLPKPDDKYTTKYDNINIDDILNNSRLLENYCKCLLDTGKCTPEGQELRKNIIDAVQNDCEKCSDKQKTQTPRVIKHMKEHKAEECFNPLMDKYDINHTYREKYA